MKTLALFFHEVVRDTLPSVSVFRRIVRHAVVGGVVGLMSFPVFAQTSKTAVKLNEVEVKADRIVYKADGMWLYPTGRQKAAAGSGYSLLQQFTLPNIRVDEVGHSVSAIEGQRADTY